MNLIIVESPTKAKTISKFISSKYKVESSFGHIRDLPKSTMGVDIDNNFEPRYIIPTKTKKLVTKLKTMAAKADEIILAVDEDREGEAIAWHLFEALELKKEKTKRIVFHEITKDAILEALENPRDLNMKMVDAQQARRVLDRLVGYELSPFLWKKVAKGLSAGRVQSVAIRMVVEREREIQKFKPEEYWSLTAILNKQGQKEDEIKAGLNKIGGKTLDRLELKTKSRLDEILKNLAGCQYAVKQVIKKETKKTPPKPFTTSSLQQTANRFYGFSAKQTMMLAQQLYESGLITYMRTDSLNLSEKFISEAADYIKNNLGDNFSKISRYKTKSKGAQEAHEAIRPTDVLSFPDEASSSLNANQRKLYKLVWQRAVASQMNEAIFDATAVDIQAGDLYEFRTNGQTMKFEGYLKIYPEKNKELILPVLEEGEILNLKELLSEQHFTKPPARYSDAGLVKELEKHGIGRPSTYAPTISTIETRNYVIRDENKKLQPTDIAFVVVDLLVEHFPKIIDYKFTAEMENEFDDIAQGKNEWQPVIKNFYFPFHENLENKYNEINKKDIMPEEKSNEICDKCGSEMIIKTGRYGKFLACSGFPECKNIKSMPGAEGPRAEQDNKLEELKEKYKNISCDKCGAPMTLKTGRFGPFLACSAYPKCKNIKSIEENSSSTGIKCPVCGKGEIVQKKSRRGTFYACDQYPDCKTAFWAKPTGEECPECKSLLVEAKDGLKCSNKTCKFKK
jgi:DNA topoisomerase I